MTDDLEPRLRDHLRQRAGRMSAPPDITDLHQRIDARGRRRTRALGAALAIALVAGPAAGWAAARTAESDRENVSAAGGGGAFANGDNTGYAGPLEGTGLGYQAPEMQFVSKRTTDQGIHLVVRSTVLGQPGNECTVDGLVRVGVVDGDLVDVAVLETAPGGASFSIAGGADGRPMWVVVVRGYDGVEAAFPDGGGDIAEATDGIAVLADYADPGQSPEDLLDDVILINGSMAGPAEDDVRRVSIADGSGGCSEPGPGTTEPPPLAMPEPGEPPVDEAAARASVEDLFLTAFDGASDPSQADLRERPDVWLDAQERFTREQPDYAAMAPSVYAVVHEVVFTSPDRATVAFSLLSDDPSVPAPGDRIGEAVLIDGMWKVAIETSCGLIGLAGIDCNMSL